MSFFYSTKVILDTFIIRIITFAPSLKEAHLVFVHCKNDLREPRTIRATTLALWSPRGSRSSQGSRRIESATFTSSAQAWMQYCYS